MCQRSAENTADFRFTEFLGCTYGNAVAYNAVGTIDYIAVAILSDYVVEETPVWDVD